MAERIVLYPGTFDPPTLGHLDVILTAVSLFDNVRIAVMVNPRKVPMFSPEERLRMLRAMIRDNDPERKCFSDSGEGLTVDLAAAIGACAIVRSLRLVTDYEAELDLAMNNAHLAKTPLPTIWIAPEQSHLHIRSSTVREILQFDPERSRHYLTQEVFDIIRTLRDF